jgi:tRNA U55 pseudouridine synthase TruB
MHNLFTDGLIVLEPECDEFDTYKPIGLTPRELVDEYLRRYPLQFHRGSFSGRLDPMAHGIIRLFFNERSGEAEKYHGSGKCYRFKMIFGLRTTSLDLMGFAELAEFPPQSSINLSLNAINAAISEIQSRGKQKLPNCCSFPVRNSAGLRKPLWWWSLMGRMDEIRDKIPVYDRSIYKWNIIEMREIKLKELCDLAIARVDSVSRRNVFHQDRIIENWRALKEMGNNGGGELILQMAEIEIEVSSGFYIRKLVEDIGTIMGISATTAEIERLYYL